MYNATSAETGTNTTEEKLIANFRQDSDKKKKV
jgi:hypothetical protein